MVFMVPQVAAWWHARVWFRTGQRHIPAVNGMSFTQSWSQTAIRSAVQAVRAGCTVFPADCGRPYARMDWTRRRGQ
jgi:hypothetical protein